MADYNLSGYRWGTNALGGSGGVVIWNVLSSTPSIFVPIIQKAFADWSMYGNITFRQASGGEAANITLSQPYIDGTSGTLGDHKEATSGSRITSATITFDSAEGWHASGSTVVSNKGLDLFVIALHEIGRAIGIGNYDAISSVMNTDPNYTISDLSSSDIHAIQALYGVAAPAATWPKLVDIRFYNSHYPDAANSSIGQVAHYDQYGWHEGRDPNAFFSTNGYLAANVDVAKAGINPLAHYDSFGWKEGRDPSASFDNELYLKNNADVAKLGIDPLAHYLQYGQAEGRQTYAAVGKASDFTHGSFDAEYYLLANADVAKAALAAGGDTFAFAFQHYQSYGGQEGRKADAFFDSAYYLAHNADVAASHINPLTHYDQYGWREGRAASAAFDTHAYLAANPDVAAAHIDPLLHYLQYGALEGRHLA